MPTLFTPEFSKSKAGDFKDDRAIRFNGDVGYGVMSEARHARLNPKKPGAES